jgi:hypothetical protein
MLFKGFTTMLAAAALAIASFSAAPAKADIDDAAKIIAGVAAVAIIGAAIADSRNDRHYVSRYYGRGYGYNHRRHYGHNYENYNPHVYRQRHHGYGHSHYHSHGYHRGFKHR